jgi:hypothetical protein
MEVIMIDNALDRLMNEIELLTRVISGLALYYFKGEYVSLVRG